jgi:hypothetical protein
VEPPGRGECKVVIVRFKLLREKKIEHYFQQF